MSDRKIYASEQYVDEKISASNTVQYILQELTEDQLMQARANLNLYNKQTFGSDIIEKQEITFDENGEAVVPYNYIEVNDGSYEAILTIGEYIYPGYIEDLPQYDVYNWEDEEWGGNAYRFESGTLIARSKAPYGAGATVTIQLHVSAETLTQIPDEYISENIARTDGLDSVVKYSEQSLSEDEQMLARENLGLYRKGVEYKKVATYGYYPNFNVEKWIGDISNVIVEIYKTGTYEVETQFHHIEYIPMVGDSFIYWIGNANLITGFNFIPDETKYTDLPFCWYYLNDEIYSNSNKEELILSSELSDTAYDYRNENDGYFVIIRDVNGDTQTIYHPIPEEYIPDTIARKEDIPEAQIQADWNQNDETQLDYIKNRPFYTISDGEYILEPTTLTFDANRSSANEILNVEDDDAYANMFTVGNTVYIAWDGVVYSATVQTHNMIGTCVGYVPESYGGSGSDEPFTITTSVAPNYISINRRDESVDELSVSFAILVSDTIPEYVQIDKKYLPIMTGAQFETDGVSGIVPQPAAGDQDKVLRGDGTWDVISQSDWNQNDEDAEDYIKNRPFYSAYGVDYKIDKKYMPEEFNNIGYTEYIEPEDVSPTLLASESIPSVEDIIGSITLAPSYDFGDGQTTITPEMITEYDWGFDFRDGFVVKNAPITIDGKTYENAGVYLRTYIYTTTTSGVDYSRYGMEIHYKYKELYIPNSIARTEDIASNYYTKEQIDNMEFITVEDIDTICGVSITNASEVLF